jgi:hypothetical protein
LGVSPALVSLARESKMTYVRIDKSNGFVAQLAATNDPKHKPALGNSSIQNHE